MTTVPIGDDDDADGGGTAVVVVDVAPTGKAVPSTGSEALIGSARYRKALFEGTGLTPVCRATKDVRTVEFPLVDDDHDDGEYRIIRRREDEEMIQRRV
ncbi:hypothetical protein EAI_14929 [Harpegnathos saltator]|uniref:Uncharacterized protein n=1 Tax=Harpegnathos saltator TaxID=610380 RepID=E2BWQ4_HARSA|nr:hypothetical protein EAI_14929 [Harpegnathos saltator]